MEGTSFDVFSCNTNSECSMQCIYNECIEVVKVTPKWCYLKAYFEPMASEMC